MSQPRDAIGGLSIATLGVSGSLLVVLAGTQELTRSGVFPIGTNPAPAPFVATGGLALLCFAGLSATWLRGVLGLCFGVVALGAVLELAFFNETPVEPTAAAGLVLVGSVAVVLAGVLDVVSDPAVRARVDRAVGG